MRRDLATRFITCHGSHVSVTIIHSSHLFFFFALEKVPVSSESRCAMHTCTFAMPGNVFSEEKSLTKQAMDISSQRSYP